MCVSDVSNPILFSLKNQQNSICELFRREDLTGFKNLSGLIEFILQE